MKRSASIAEFATTLIRLIDSRIRATICDGVVISVDKTAFTCDVKVQETTFTDIPLRVMINSQASFVEVPKVNTNVLITFRDANSGRPQLLEVHECEEILTKCDKVIFNDGLLGGMVKVDDLTTKLNNLEDKYNSLLQILQTISIPLAPSGTYPFAPLFITETPLTPTNKTELENEKIKQ
jgi:hypothetical protein